MHQKLFNKKKLKIDVLIDNRHSFLNSYVNEAKKIIQSSHSFRFFKNVKSIKKGDIMFSLGCSKILKNNSLIKHKLNLIIHPSKLPDGRGSAPIFWQILKKKKKFFITIFNANEKIDQGDIYLVKQFNLNGSELHDEIRKIQGNLILEMIKIFKKRKLFNKKPQKQKGKGSYFQKRKPIHSEMNINKSLRSQFNLLRICSNDFYPAFFKFKNKKYIIKIFKDKN